MRVRTPVHVKHNLSPFVKNLEHQNLLSFDNVILKKEANTPTFMMDREGGAELTSQVFLLWTPLSIFPHSLPAYGPISVPRRIQFRENTPNLAPGIVDRLMHTCRGTNDNIISVFDSIIWGVGYLVDSWLMKLFVSYWFAKLYIKIHIRLKIAE